MGRSRRVRLTGLLLGIMLVLVMANLPRMADASVPGGSARPADFETALVEDWTDWNGRVNALPAAVVVPTVETDPVHSGGDAADDPAIWVHPTDPGLSTVIGTDKSAGIGVYDLTGDELQFLGDGDLNNVDLRYNFPLGGQSVALVTAGNRSDDTIAIYRVNPVSRLLEDVAARSIPVGISEVYGSCMYHSPVTGKYYFIVNDTDGQVEQWELFDDGSGQVDAQSVRQFSVGSQTEGCVADDERAELYVGEEEEGVWKYGAEPEDGSARTQVDSTGAGGHLTHDVEGLALYYASDGSGYLIASSQGSSEFVIYERTGNNSYVGTFDIPGGGGIDEVTVTDGIDVTNFALGSAFPNGMFVAQDDSNDGGHQNYKLVPWESIANEFGLTIDTSWDPRQVGAPSVDRDLAVTSLVPGAGSVVKGNTVTVQVNLSNQGSEDIGEDITVTLEDLTDGVDIGTHTIAGGLDAAASTSFDLDWNTAGASFGAHMLEASHDVADDTPGNDFATASVTVSNPSATPETITFQQGVNGYSGTVDTFLEEHHPDDSSGSDNVVEWDEGSGRDQIGLIRFDDLFGPQEDRIPEGAEILSATLTYYVANVGNTAQVNEVAIDWDESVTYNTFGNSPGVQGEDYGAAAGNASGDPAGFHPLDVTDSLAAWASDPSANRGWVFLPVGTNGVQVISSEYSDIALRPALEVEYLFSTWEDLAVTGLVASPGAVVVGETVAVDVTLTNQGDQAITGDIGVSLDNLTLGGNIGSQTVSGGLAAGASTTVSFTWNTGGLASDSYTIQASHDFSDDDPVNDAATTQVVVTAAFTDLAVTNLVASPGTVVSGYTVTFDATLNNLGNQDVTSDITVSLDNLTLGGNIGSQTVPGGLAAGAATPVSFSWNTGGVALDSYDIQASHNFNDDAPGNNSDTTQVTVVDVPNDLSFGLLAHWKLDESSGDTSADSSGNGHHGTLINGPTWVPGVAGNALEYHRAQGQTVLVPHSAELNPNGDSFSISLWVKYTDSGDADLIRKGSTNTASDWYKLEIHADNRIGFNLNTTLDSSTTLTSPLAYNDGQWHHVVAIRDIGSGQLYLYIDNALVNDHSNPGGSISSSASLSLGSKDTLDDDFLEGSLDDIRLYDRALSAVEVEDLFDLDITPPTAPQNLSAAAGESVDLSWEAAADQDSGVVSYNIYRDTAPGTAKALIASLADSSAPGATVEYHDSDTALATTYYYEVSAVDGAGLEGARSNEASATTETPVVGDLVVHLPLDDGSGSTATDVSGNGHHGTLVNGPTWVAGQVGGALQLDGSDDFVDLGTLDVVGDGITLAAWVYLNDLSGDIRFISKATGTSANDHWWLLGERSDKLRMRVKAGPGGNTETLIGTSGADLPTNQWVHVAGTYDGNQMTVYVDGVAVDSKAKSGAVAVDPSVGVTVGKNPAGAGHHLDGMIDDVRIYNMGLSAAEIAALAAGVPPANQPPAADAGPDQTVTDSDDNSAESLTLDGSGSSDPDGAIVSYAWSEGGNQVATGVSPSVSLAVGPHTLTLLVTDDDGATGTDDVVVTVNPPANQPPAANAGPDQTVTDSDDNGSETVTLDGSGSSDPDGAIVSYAWAEGGNQVATGISPSVSLAVGTHTLTLLVTDDDGATDTDDVVIVVEEPAASGSLAGYWPFDEGAGLIAGDASGNGNDGILTNGPAWGNGLLGGGIHFDGADDHVLVGDQPELDITGDLTLAVWVYRECPPCSASPDQSRKILTKYDFGNDQRSYYLGVTVGGNPEMRVIGDGTAATQVSLISPTPITNFQWQHIAGVYDASAQTMKVFLNGVLVAETASAPPGIHSGTAPVAIGTEFDNEQLHGDKFHGFIDDVRIYDEALTDSEVGALASVLAPPIASAGPDQAVVDSDGNGSEEVTLDGSGSGDFDGTIVSYEWTEGGSLIGTGVSPAVNLGLGTHNILLTVTDDDGGTGTDQVSITVDSPGSGNLLALWDFDEGTGAIANDSSGNGNHGTLFNGAGWGPGVLGNALDLDGVDDHVEVPDIDFGTGPFTMAGWFLKREEGRGDMVNKKTANSSTNFSIILDANEIARAYLGGNAVVGTTPFSLNEWHHLAVVRESASNWKIYLDGVLDGTGVHTPPLDGDVNIWIGSEHDQLFNPTFALDGMIDELQFYDYGLSAGEVADLVSADPGNEAPIADAGPDQTATDSDNNGSESVTLDGSGSSDPDGVIVSYVWSEGGNQVATGVSPSVSLALGTHTLTLLVTDDDGATDSDDLVVTVNPGASGDLVVYLPLDDGSGATATDVSGNGNHGTLVNGPTWVAGQVGGALQLDGTDDFVDLGTLDVVGDGITMAAWVYLNDLSGDVRFISKATGTSEDEHWWLLSERENKLRMRVKTEPAGFTETLIGTSGEDLPTNQWVHVAGTYDGSQMVVYVNGVAVGSASKSGAVAVDPSVGVTVGKNPAESPHLLDGMIDDVRIYNRGLSAGEVAALAGLPPGTRFSGGGLVVASAEGSQVGGSVAANPALVAGPGPGAVVTLGRPSSLAIPRPAGQPRSATPLEGAGTESRKRPVMDTVDTGDLTTVHRAVLQWSKANAPGVVPGATLAYPYSPG